MSALAPLRLPAFRRLFLARTVTHLGNAVAPIALAFAVLDLTGSVASLGLVIAARSAANVALLLLGGVLADRLPRQVVLTGSELLAAASQAAVAALVLTETASVPLLAGLGLVNGAAAAASLPATSALIPQTVPEQLLRQANAVSRIGVSTAMVSGAALGGALVAAVGPGWGLAIDAASFAVAAACFAGIRVDVMPSGPSVSILNDLRAGWAEFRSRTWVWIVVVQFGVVNAALVGGVAVLGPAVADASFGRGAWGVALALQGVGLLLGGVLALRWQPQRLLAWGVLMTFTLALPLLALAHSPALPVVGAALLLSGLAIEQFTVAWDVSLQQNLPADRLARVYSYDLLGSSLAVPFGQVVAGPVAEQVGLTLTLQASAALIVIATALALCSRSVRALRQRPPSPTQALPDAASA